jgi:hypothetical protein
MADLINLVGRLRAHREGRAVRAATHRQVTIAPHALIIAPLAMAGEDTAIHAIAIGQIDERPLVRTVPDPRVRDDQYKLVEWVGAKIEDYYATCRDSGDHPQFWVSSGAAAGHLDILADRLRFTRDAPRIKRAGELLTYATERYPVDGQQALVTATGALAAHYCTGQQEGEDEHLGAFLTWLDPPAGVDIARAVEAAERQVMGVKTDPEFDRNELAPLVGAYNRARKENAPPAEIRRRAAAIEAKLSPIVTTIYDAVQRALGYLQGFQPAGVLSELSTRECQEFESFMNARDRGMPLPYRDNPKAAAFKISEREAAVQNLQRGSLYGDEMAQARARLDGTILNGIISNRSDTKVGRKTIQRFTVETTQTNLHLRSADELALLRDPRLRCVVEDVSRAGAATRVSFLVTAGMNCVGAPQDGTVVDLAPPPPEWFRLIKQRQKMAARLSERPWTHGEVGLPAPQAAPTAARPNDLLAAVESLR